MKKSAAIILICIALLSGCKGKQPKIAETAETTAVTTAVETTAAEMSYYIISDGETADGFIYDVIHKKDGAEYAIIRGHNAPPENMVIPAYIDDYPVHKISYGAFSYNLTLKSVSIPDTVTEIDGCFTDCENLETIEIPESVTKIGSYTFENTLWLENKKAENPFVAVNNILIDGSLMTGDVVIPDNIIDISSGAFVNSEITSVTIPEGITVINSSTFMSCCNLKEVSLPSTLTEIHAAAFSDCTALTSIDIPDSVTYISWMSFQGCDSLSEISLPPNPEYIGSSAFDDTQWLINKQQENPYVIVSDILVDGAAVTGEAVIPDGVVTIGEYAFRNNENITSVTLPDSVKVISERAFDSCINLGSFAFSKTLEEVGFGTFDGCEKLTRLNIPNEIDIGIFDDSYGFNDSGISVTASYQGDNWIYENGKFVNTTSTMER